MKPIVAITMGDPRGVGPEVVVKALSREALRQACCPLILGDPLILRRTVEVLGLRLKVAEIEEGSIPEMPDEGLGILPLSRLLPGKDPTEVPPEESSIASFRYLEKAGKMALAGQVDAVTTGPVSKGAIARAGIPFQGHTEFFAGLAGTKDFVMMLSGERLRVALVTTHAPLSEVSRSLKEERIFSVVEITGRSLREYFGFPNPRIAVAAFNPHGGEDGLFGEEEKIISRAVDQARGEDWAVSGPWPADSLFHRAVQGEYDAVVCMYHDQGLIPLKLLHFHTAVNVTLGLSFIRTSVDHGVAYDIAGKGVASPRSMEEAIKMAAQMAIRKRQEPNPKNRMANR